MMDMRPKSLLDKVIREAVTNDAVLLTIRAVSGCCSSCRTNPSPFSKTASTDAPRGSDDAYAHLVGEPMAKNVEGVLLKLNYHHV